MSAWTCHFCGGANVTEHPTLGIRVHVCPRVTNSDDWWLMTSSGIEVLVCKNAAAMFTLGAK